MYNGFLLGVEHAGGKLGCVNTEISVMNSALKPEVAVRRINKLQDRVNLDFVVGFVFSNILIRDSIRIRSDRDIFRSARMYISSFNRDWRGVFVSPAIRRKTSPP